MNLEIVDDQIEIVEIDIGFPPNVDLSGVAFLANDQVFTGINTFPVIRITPILVINDYAITQRDGQIVVDCSINDTDITLELPLSNGTGQDIRIDRKDTTAHNVNVITQGSDVIASGLTVMPISPGQGVLFAADLVDFWAATPLLPATVLPDDIAYVDKNNYFTGINSFGGFRWARRVISDSYAIQPQDFIIYVKDITSDIDIYLPPALLIDTRGQPILIQRLDDTDFVVRVNPFVDDLVDFAASSTLIGRLTAVLFIEGELNNWYTFGVPSSVGGGGATIAATTNLIAGDGAGNGVDSGIDPTAVVIADPSYPTPTNDAETRALLQHYGLCA